MGAAAALGVLALRGAPLPRTPLDIPILGLLAAFALATASAMNHGMSLRAMASVTAFALALPIALLAVRHRPSWVGAITSVPVLLLAVPSLVVLLSRRLDWVVAGAPGPATAPTARRGHPVRIGGGAALRHLARLGACRAHRAARVAAGGAHRPRGGRDSADHPLRLAIRLAGHRVRGRGRRAAVGVGAATSASVAHGLGRADGAAGGSGPAGRGDRRRAGGAAPDRGDVAPLPRDPVARHAGRLADRSAPRDRAGLHAVRPAGGRRRLHVPGSPAALPQPAARRAG